MLMEKVYYSQPKECLLSKIQQRNSFLKIKNYNHIFKKYLGAKKVIWLNKGIA